MYISKNNRSRRNPVTPAPISFQAVTKRYGSVAAVDALSLEIPGGEFISLLGPSGCGKTTSLRMLAGFIAPDAGDIRIGGSSVLKLGPERRPTAMVFQRYTLWAHMNVFHNVAFGLKLRGVSNAEMNAKVGRMLELVGLPGFEKRLPGQLSGGQQQRVALARALVVEPQVLLLDEPLSSLDARLRVSLRDEIRAIQRQLGITTVFVTHDQEEALAVSDRIAVMNAGRLHQVASPSELYARPATLFAAQFIGSMNLISGTVNGGTLEAGLIRLPAPGLRDGAVTLAIRPEDIQLGRSGIRASLEGITDLGHYRRLNLRAGDAELIAFSPRGTDLSGADCLRVTRALVYQSEGLLTELKPEAVGMAV
jgi:putative spermidine/putrescine transport system ATP-binding protein